MQSLKTINYISHLEAAINVIKDVEFYTQNK